MLSTDSDNPAIFFNQECQKFVPKSGEAWPMGRVEHAACCLGFGERPQLLLIGGLCEGNRTLNDIWIMDLESMKWKEVLGIFFQFIVILISIVLCAGILRCLSLFYSCRFPFPKGSSLDAVTL